MGFFDYLQKPGAKSIKQQPLKIRKEVVKTDATHARTSLAPSKPRMNGRLLSPNEHSKKRAYQGPTTPLSRTAGSRKQRGTPETAQKFSSDESDSDNAENTSSKKAKHSVSCELDTKRHVRSVEAFSENNADYFPVVHAADITSVDTSIKFVPAWEGLTQRADVLLQYPSNSQPER